MPIQYDEVDLKGDQQAFLDSLTEEERDWQNHHTWVPTSPAVMVWANRYDITQMVGKITWSGQKSEVSRKLVVDIVHDDNYHMPKFTVEMHDVIQLFLDDDEVFRGYVVDVQRSLNDKSISYTCYDAGFFLLKSKGKYKFSGETPDAVVKKVCADLEIPVDQVEPGEPYTRIHDQDTFYDIIMTGYTITSGINGKQYYLRFDKGALSVLKKGKQVYRYMLTAKRDITAAQFTSSSVNAINRVKAYDESGTEVGTFALDNADDFPGILQAVYKAENGADTTTAAKALLKDIELTASIEGFGVVECTTGHAVVVAEPTTGLDGLFYIDGDNHVFANGIHTMSLDLAFENLMDQVNAGQTEETSTMESLGIGGDSVQERVWNYLRAKGFSAAATAGIMGNIERESGFNPRIEEYGNAVGYGLCQWSYERRTNLINWCKNNGRDYTTVSGQLDYLMYELEGGDTTCVALMAKYGGLNGFKKMTSVEKATTVFQECFERAGAVYLQERIQFAYKYYNKWKNYTTIPTSSGSTAGANGMASSAVMGVHAGKYGLAYPVPNCTGISAFTYPGHTNHARDFQPPGNAWGTPIVSVLDGVVQTAGYHWSYGNNVYIDHGNGWMSRYAHLQSLNVRAGQGVKKGQVVGGCGSTGDSTGLHLHMELHTPWGWADPGPFFSSYGYCYLTGNE